MTTTVKYLKTDSKISTPQYAHPGDAGLDLFAAEDAFISESRISYIKTGLHFEIPRGYVGMLVSRSSTLKNFGFIIPNSVGIIDSGYRGEMSVVAYGFRDQQIKRGDKIAQILIMPVAQVKLVEVEELQTSSRGSGGFGSTGRVGYL